MTRVIGWRLVVGESLGFVRAPHMKGNEFRPSGIVLNLTTKQFMLKDLEVVSVSSLRPCVFDSVETPHVCCNIQHIQRVEDHPNPWISSHLALDLIPLGHQPSFFLEGLGNHYWLLAWNIFIFSHILGEIIPIDFHIFRRGSNHQPVMV